MRTTSADLGLPTQRYNRDHVTKLELMRTSEIERILAKQKELLSRKDICLLNKNEKLQKAIKEAEEILEKRKNATTELAEDFSSICLCEPRFPVCGKRQFIPNQTKRSNTSTLILPILSLEEGQKALEACKIKIGDNIQEIVDKNVYRGRDADKDDLDSDDPDAEYVDF